MGPSPNNNLKVVDSQPLQSAGLSVVGSEPLPDESAYKKPEGSAASRFLGGLWNTTVGGLGTAAKVVADIAAHPTNPMAVSPETQQAIYGIIQSHADQAQKAKAAWERGDHAEAAGHLMASALPVVGPAAAHAGERIGGTQPKFDKYGNVTEPGQEPDIAGGLGEATGLIASSSPKNILGPVASKAGEVAGKMIPERMSPEGIYQSALRPSLAKKNLPKIDSEVKTGLREGIPVSRKGLAQTDAAIEDTNAEIADKLQQKSDQFGPVVSPSAVASRVEQVRPTFAEQVNPEPDLSVLSKSKQQFLDRHTTEAPYTKLRPGMDEAEGTLVPDGEGSTPIEQPMTLSEAQAEKQGTYRQLRKKYGELGSADVEAQKALARGLKEEIVKRVPELAGLNARDSALIDLQAQLEKMVAREGNKNLLGLVPAVMSHNPTGFLATLMMDNPVVKSKIAIALDRLRTAGKAVGAPPAMAVGPASVTGAVANQQLPHYAKGGVIHKPTLLVDLKSGKPTGIMAEKGPERISPMGPPTLKAPGREVKHLVNSENQKVENEMGESGEDFIRGSSNIPLSPMGMEQVDKLGQQFKRKGGVDKIVSSDLLRAKQTADAISRHTGAPVTATKGLRPWHLGEIEGQPTKQVINKMNSYMTRKPDVAVPGKGMYSGTPGESFNSFKRRTIGAFQKLLQEHAANPDAKISATTHYRDVKLAQSWIKKGAPPSMEIDTKHMMGKGDSPGSVHRLFLANGKPHMEPVDMKNPGKLKGGIYLTRHGVTALNQENGKPPLLKTPA